MESSNPPKLAPQDAEFMARLQTLHEIKTKMEQLHARLEFVRLMLKLGVRLQ